MISTTTAYHPFISFVSSNRIYRRPYESTIPIQTPFANITMHIIKSPRVRLI